MGTVKSKIILSRIFSECAFEVLSSAPSDKQKCLREMVGRLQIMAAGYKAQSRDMAVKPRHRARARDYEQNAYGLINGILFATATIYESDCSDG